MIVCLSIGPGFRQVCWRGLICEILAGKSAEHCNCDSRKGSHPEYQQASGRYAGG
jgi:hypothetical protein